MDTVIPKNLRYNEYLNKIISEQSKRITEFEYLLPSTPNEWLATKYYLDSLQRDFFYGRRRKIKLTPRPHELKLMKPKRDRLSIIKSRTNTSKKVKITKNVPSEQFWILNPSDNINEIKKEISKLREKHGVEKYNKHIKMYYYNYIKSFYDVKKHLTEVCRKEDNAFKLQIAFGYACENLLQEHRIFEPSRQFYFDDYQLIKNRQDLDNIFHYLSGDEIRNKISLDFSESSTRLVGVYAMGVKIVRLDYLLGSNIQLPKYITSSKFIISLEKVENNLCAWACFAIISGSSKARYLTKAKELFVEFYGLNKLYKKLIYDLIKFMIYDLIKFMIYDLIK